MPYRPDREHPIEYQVEHRKIESRQERVDAARRAETRIKLVSALQAIASRLDAQSREIARLSAKIDALIAATSSPQPPVSASVEVSAMPGAVEPRIEDEMATTPLPSQSPTPPAPSRRAPVTAADRVAAELCRGPGNYRQIAARMGVENAGRISSVLTYLVRAGRAACSPDTHGAARLYEIR